MSAAAAPSSLLHKPPAKPTERDLLEIRVTGTLLDDAELRFTPGSDGKSYASLMVRLLQPLGRPYEAWQYIGTEPVQHIAAAAKQQLLKRGDRVTIYARGIRARTDHGHAVMALEHVTDVIPLHIDRSPTDQQEPNHAH